MRERRREHRRSKRVRKRQAAFIGYDEGDANIPCVVWDLSRGGARLSAAHTDALPGTFILFFDKEHTSRRYCRVVWRKGAQVGVQFVPESEMKAASVLHQANIEAATSAPVSAQEFEPASGQIAYQLHRSASAVKVERRGSTLSSLCASLVILLGVVTAALIAAGMQATGGAPWALQVCTSAKSFCEHPEFSAAAGVMMMVIYLTMKGMEL